MSDRNPTKRKHLQQIITGTKSPRNQITLLNINKSTFQSKELKKVKSSDLHSKKSKEYLTQRKMDKDISKCVRVMIMNGGQDDEHYIEVNNGESIIEYLNSYYRGIYYKTINNNNLIDFLLTEEKLSTSFLIGKSISLRAHRLSNYKHKVSLKDF